MIKKVTSKTRRFPPKKLLPAPEEKTILPKRMSQDEIKTAVKEAVDAEVVTEEYVPETPAADMKTITLTVDPNPKGKSTIDLGGVSIPDAIFVIKGFHSYLVNEFNKRVALVNGNQEGSADSTSGSNT
jgi:hypothetical protein